MLCIVGIYYYWLRDRRRGDILLVGAREEMSRRPVREAQYGEAYGICGGCGKRGGEEWEGEPRVGYLDSYC